VRRTVKVSRGGGFHGHGTTWHPYNDRKVHTIYDREYILSEVFPGFLFVLE
jgi:hypothetical protein